jgi:4-hydroxybenzoate decarboxylase subunit C
MFPDLRTFLDRLRRDDDLVTVDVPVDSHLEVAEIHRRVIAGGGPALLFTNVQVGGQSATSGGQGSPHVRSPFPLATNLYGTARRAELAFGERPHRLIRRLVDLVHEIMPPTPSALWGARDVAMDLLKVGLRRVPRGPVVDRVTRDVRLDRLPALTCWHEDGGPFITLPLVYTQHPDTRAHNLGIYRMQVHDAATTGMHWQIGKGGGFHYAVAEARGASLPVTVFLGGPPALTLAAIAPLPENVPELMLASMMIGERLPRVTGYGPHPLIATAEFALIGDVPPRERRPEGPFGDHYGYYSLQHDYPVFNVRTMAHRDDAIYPATVVGKPRQEDFYIGDLLQELLSPLFPVVMPGVEQLWSYGETGYHSLAAAVVKQRYAREAMASAFRILGEGQLSLTKFLFLTDRYVDLRNFTATLEHVLARTRPETDLYVFSNLSMDTLDYTGPRVNEGSKGVWLGLGDPVRDLPRQFSGLPPSGVTDVRVFCGGCLVVTAEPRAADPGAAARLAKDSALAGWPLVIVSDAAQRATASAMNFLWTTFTRFEPAADIYSAATEVIHNHIAYRGPIVIDARLKPGFPKELTCREDIAARVTARWKEYFPSTPVEMGDAERAHLA